MAFIVAYMIMGPVIYFGAAVYWIAVFIYYAALGKLDFDTYDSLIQGYNNRLKEITREQTIEQTIAAVFINICILWPVKIYEQCELFNRILEESCN